MCWFTQPSKFRAVSCGFDPVGMVLCNDVVTTSDDNVSLCSIEISVQK